MTEIWHAIGTVKSVCGKQRINGQAAYRQSRYCLSIPCAEGTLLYHTLTGALFLFGEGETMADHRDRLIEEWFLVPEGFSEQKQTDGLRQVIRLLKPGTGTITGFTILPTTDCNARCYYCYERGARRLTMTEQTARDAAAYIAKKCKGQPVTLSWFGGEPLYNLAAIDVICEELRRMGVPFTSSMISNLFLLDEPVARRAAERWHMEHIQVTIDGTAEKYNRTKAYIHAEGDAFERVLGNIAHALRAGITVTVRLHLDSPDLSDLCALCELLKERFQNHPGLTVGVSFIKSGDDKHKSFADLETASAAYDALEDKLRETGLYGLRKLDRNLLLNKCKADNEKCETIFPDGSVGRCENPDESNIVGSIYNDKRNESVVKAWEERRLIPECAACAMYPKCIMLKKCIWNTSGCTEYSRARRIRRLKEQVLQAYEEQALNGENKGAVHGTEQNT